MPASAHKCKPRMKSQFWGRYRNQEWKLRKLASGKNKKGPLPISLKRAFLASKHGSGGWIRTNGLRVMSPTSFHCSTPRWIKSLIHSWQKPSTD